MSCESCDSEISQKLDMIAALLQDLKARIEALENEPLEVDVTQAIKQALNI